MYDCLIIGGGLAGLTAAIYTARAGLSTAVIEGEQCGGQAVMADLVENYPGFVGSGYELAEKTQQQAENVGVEIIYDEIESVDFEGKVKKAVGFENSYEGKFVIVATGAKHKRAGFQGEENFTGAGVSYCAVCDGAFFADMEVAVIGGANTAVSEAIYLSNICKKVYLIYRKDKLRADNTLVERLNTKENIEVLYNTIPVKVDGNDSVEKLITDKGELSVKGVFVAVGFNPSTTIFENKLELDEYGYIKTDSNLATNVSGVFRIMRLSKKTIYAIILMLSIVKWEESEVITIKKVAERENLSVKYLEQVVSVLCKSGFVKSQRGAKGGYRLSKAPEQYTVGSIVRAMEGVVTPESIEEPEPINGFLKGLCTTVNKYMDSVTIVDLIEEEKISNNIFDYCI